MDHMEPAQKIRTKVIAIMITNACNLACGGCNQLVGHFTKKKIFHLSIADIRAHIRRAIAAAQEDWAQPWYPILHKNITIYGGEPTTHPEWPQILQMLYEEFPDWPFLVLTNGRTLQGKPLAQSGDTRFDYLKTRDDVAAHDRNVFWRVDLKTQDTYFIPTLLAPVDILGEEDPLMYFEMAQKNCYIYERCETILYRDKGYFCLVAGAMDWLFHDGANGWELEESAHPFRRTNEEVIEQAKLFCHRCHYSFNPQHEVADILDIPSQPVLSKSFVSKSNFDQIRKGSGQLVVFDEEDKGK